jgi:hypothetical protein
MASRVPKGGQGGGAPGYPGKGAGGTGPSFSEGNSWQESDARRESTVDAWAGGDRSGEGSIAPAAFVEVSAISQASTTRGAHKIKAQERICSSCWPRPWGDRGSRTYRTFREFMARQVGNSSKSVLGRPGLGVHASPTSLCTIIIEDWRKFVMFK